MPHRHRRLKRHNHPFPTPPTNHPQSWRYPAHACKQPPLPFKAPCSLSLIPPNAGFFRRCEALYTASVGTNLEIALSANKKSPAQRYQTYFITNPIFAPVYKRETTDLLRAGVLCRHFSFFLHTPAHVCDQAFAAQSFTITTRLIAAISGSKCVPGFQLRFARRAVATQ